MPLDRPIPAFYCCYLLRSTVRRSSVYVGSTPNPGEQLHAPDTRRALTRGQYAGLASTMALRKVVPTGQRGLHYGHGRWHV
jgi:hypothetical protein